MLYKRCRYLLAAGVAFGLAFAPSTVVAAEGQATAAASKAVEHRVSPSAQALTAEYWTPERMAAAVPPKAVGDSKVPDSVVEEAIGGATTGSEPVAGKRVETAPGAPKLKVTATQVVGKVFFRGSDGIDYVCSGSAVNSTNKNMVFTAGHCVHGGPGQGWASNWQFVPYYNYGNRPYGTWWAETLVAFNGWVNSGNFGYDVGIVITSPNSSGELVNAVGGLGIQWNYPKDRFMVAMGYPASGAFDGQWQYFCSATTSQRSSSIADQIKMPCNMTGGSSGGPWLFGKDDNVYWSGYVNGVNSNTERRDNPTEMRSPYFATWVGDAFNTYSTY
ncbi:trypsin-like serine peptidase [Streptomyces sp. S6]